MKINSPGYVFVTVGYIICKEFKIGIGYDIAVRN